MTSNKAKKARWHKCGAPQLVKKGKLVHQQTTQRSGLSQLRDGLPGHLALKSNRTCLWVPQDCSKEAAVPECGSTHWSYVSRARCRGSRPKHQLPSLFWNGSYCMLYIHYLRVWLLICMHLDADCYPPLLEDTPAMQINHTLYYIKTMWSFQ